MAAKHRTKTPNDYLKGQISAYCELVDRGKPTAMLPIQDRYIDELEKHIQSRYKLQTHKENLAEGWVTLWIYKKDHMLPVIRNLPAKPKTVFDHWVLGKAFGYSEEAISEFILKQE